MNFFILDAAPVTHPTVSFCSAAGSSFLDPCALSYGSLLSSALAIAVTLGICFWIRATLASGRPTKPQMLLEMLLSYVTDQVSENISPDAVFAIPIAATIGLYILVANWMDFLPLGGVFIPANADLNQTLAMGLVVILVAQWHSFSVLGFRGYFYRYTKPFDANLFVRVPFVILNIIEEVVKPFTLALRLFGNIFAGVLMVYLLSTQIRILPASVLLVVVWKFFDVFFIGTIQALIFMVLTIIYFGMAREGLHELEGKRKKSGVKSLNLEVGEGI